MDVVMLIKNIDIASGLVNGALRYYNWFCQEDSTVVIFQLYNY
jgi:hypothetical protein